MLQDAGYTVTQATPSQWAADSTAQFQGYAALVIGDPSTASSVLDRRLAPASLGTHLAERGVRERRGAGHRARAGRHVRREQPDHGCGRVRGGGLFLVRAQRDGPVRVAELRVLDRGGGHGRAAAERGGGHRHGGRAEGAGRPVLQRPGHGEHVGGRRGGHVRRVHQQFAGRRRRGPRRPARCRRRSIPGRPCSPRWRYDAAADATANFTASDGVTGQPYMLLGAPVQREHPGAGAIDRR